MAPEPPGARSPVSHARVSIAVAVWFRSPTLVQVTVVPTLTRMRAGPNLYSMLLLAISTLSTPSAIGPVGPATVGGGGGGHSGCTWPFKEKDHTASPFPLPIIWLPPVAMAMYCSPSTS